MFFRPPNRRGSSISIIFLAVIIALVADMYCSATPVPTDVHRAPDDWQVAKPREFKYGEMDFKPPVTSVKDIPTYDHYVDRRPHPIHDDVKNPLLDNFGKLIGKAYKAWDPQTYPESCHFLMSQIWVNHNQDSPRRTPQVFNVDNAVDHFYIEVRATQNRLRSIKVLPGAELPPLSGFLVVTPGSKAGTGSAVFHYSVAKIGEREQYRTLTLEDHDDLTAKFWTLFQQRPAAPPLIEEVE
ncbi:hypothetical protein EV361DRAFT_926883 [Lentinula raphanica]|uniref:Uncharacterized protein n=1 Tax=Lentinula raphanica TaxID=153919 RepID=A0AA38UCG7_9AGAR|nr:hypothetical protein F5878DRAFT_625049 [Lentinula raphanica]KAJ3968262.1 hypothetical protein EV361DRAFT_926883 [Lentinula raphanica]